MSKNKQQGFQTSLPGLVPGREEPGYDTPKGPTRGCNRSSLACGVQQGAPRQPKRAGGGRSGCGVFPNFKFLLTKSDLILSLVVSCAFGWPPVGSTAGRSTNATSNATFPPYIGNSPSSSLSFSLSLSIPLCHLLGSLGGGRSPEKVVRKGTRRGAGTS